MTHSAYLLIGNSETGIEQALRAVENILGDAKGADITTLRYGLFSVDDARALSDIAFRTARTKAGRALIVSAERLFHEAQNALLKLFEEPPEHTLIILVVPSSGTLLPTLRSRLRELPKESRHAERGAGYVEEFLKASTAERERILAKLIERSRSDDTDKKQAARTETLRLAEGLARAAYALQKNTTIYGSIFSEGKRNQGVEDEIVLFLRDLDRFIPILNDRAAPLKPILEHISLTLPRSLQSK